MRISDWSSDVCSSDLSTGSIPATAELLRTVASLPQGAVVLPGLDLESDDAVWREIRDDPGHPQHGMARSEEHTSELQSLMRISYAVFCLKKKRRSSIIYP